MFLRALKHGLSCDWLHLKALETCESSLFPGTGSGCRLEGGE
jgi:hypothetical protein